MISRLAILGGTGLTEMEGLELLDQQAVETPYGPPSDLLQFGRLFGAEIVFLARHGKAHTIAPHQINYRANLWALQKVGVQRVIAFAATGGIHGEMTPAAVVIPDQIVDYTYGREHTFFEGGEGEVTHVDFSEPYCAALRQDLLVAAGRANVSVMDGGVYGATQGPRLETAAEIQRMKRDGCDLVGMTGMPEAALARELGLCYATISIVANWAAGLSFDEITIDDVRNCVKRGMGAGEALLRAFLADQKLSGL